MSIVNGGRGSKEADEQWILRGETVQNLQSAPVKVPARTLTDILDKCSVKSIDLLSVDVDGFELQVLEGLDFFRYRPYYIVIEESGTADIRVYLESKGRSQLAILNERPFTCDVLYGEAT
jgi:FkbM family methyltransferase